MSFSCLSEIGRRVKFPTVNRFVLHTLHPNIAHLAIITRKRALKMKLRNASGKSKEQLVVLVRGKPMMGGEMVEVPRCSLQL